MARLGRFVRGNSATGPKYTFSQLHRRMKRSQLRSLPEGGTDVATEPVPDRADGERTYGTGGHAPPADRQPGGRPARADRASGRRWAAQRRDLSLIHISEPTRRTPI